MSSDYRPCIYFFCLCIFSSCILDGGLTHTCEEVISCVFHEQKKDGNLIIIFKKYYNCEKASLR